MPDWKSGLELFEEGWELFCTGGRFLGSLSLAGGGGGSRSSMGWGAAGGRELVVVRVVVVERGGGLHGKRWFG